MTMARTLMIQGTTSDAGKSALVTGLCRAMKNRGFRVAPFKPQNMALNSAVTQEGGEIGRAQALQAVACGLPPSTDMNPILLKPNCDQTSQVIVQGRAVGTMNARQYHAYKPQVMPAVLQAHHRLSQTVDVVIVEGAGSPAEINLRDHDIANMGFAEAIDCPVILVADIDRGGVFAHVVGTLELLRPSEQARLAGVVINRFRGDPALLQPGITWLEKRIGKPVLGLLPYLHGLQLEAEDSVGMRHQGNHAGALRIVVPRLPRISNPTDFEPLRHHPQVTFSLVPEGEAHPPADLIILPGSKSVIADLRWLEQEGWPETIRRHLRYGGRLLGICGGFQMLGQSLDDPLGLEGQPEKKAGLGWLDLTTVLQPEKRLANVQGHLTFAAATVSGYEIHAGISQGPDTARPAITLGEDHTDGAISADRQVMGTYLHGLFDTPTALSALLNWAGLSEESEVDYQTIRDQQIERLAQAVEEHLDMDALLALIP